MKLHAIRSSIKPQYFLEHITRYSLSFSLEIRKTKEELSTKYKFLSEKLEHMRKSKLF